MSLVLTSCLNSLVSKDEPEFVPPTIPVSKLEALDPGTQVPIKIEEPTESPTEVLPTPTVVLVPIPTSTPLPTETPVPTKTPTPTSTPESVLPTPTPTPAPVGPQEGQLTPDGQLIYSNGAWRLVATPTPNVTATPTVLQPTFTPIPLTPTPVPQYGVVSSNQVKGRPDSLDYSSGPTVSDNKLSFTATYVTRGLGIPTVVQLWQRNGHSDAVASDANIDDCFSQGPAAFYRMPPARGMQYSKSQEVGYKWIYCINGYKVDSMTTVPWVNATSWTYDTTGALETFVFEGSALGVNAGFPQTPGKWVVVIFSGNTILSEKVLQ